MDEKDERKEDLTSHLSSQNGPVYREETLGK